MMHISDMLTQLIILLVKEGDIPVVVDRASKEVYVRSLYVLDGELHVEPVDH